MNPAWIIQKKRDGHELSENEIREFIQGLSTGEVADYQATAFLMAVYFQSMSLNETVALTRSMLESGERYDLSRVQGPKVDKHSTGGVGDKVSLILAPLAAACGLKVPMMSGRGLGHSGGTLDKLESIPGFRVGLSYREFREALSQVGCAMIGQSEKMVPADKKLYSLRDVTGTVECIPLIAASILSKKIAEGTNALVLDVKVGSGAFMKTRQAARKLAQVLVQVARKMGLPCRALLTDMNQPLGYAVGNALEVRECIEVLKNDPDSASRSKDLRELTLELCAQMLELGKVSKNITQARKKAEEKLRDGSAWKVFQEMVHFQGGPTNFENSLFFSRKTQIWSARKTGIIAGMNTEQLGKILVGLGGGRKRASDSIDTGVGLIFHRKLGKAVRKGEALVEVYAPDSLDLAPWEEAFHEAIEIRGQRKTEPRLILERL